MLWRILIVLFSYFAQILSDNESPSKKPRAKTEFGIVEGTLKVSDPGSRTFSAFEGIPYAVPPMQSLRFKPPKKLSEEIFYKPHEPLKAVGAKSHCPQIDQMTGDYSGSEDCLYLNVFSPEREFLTGVKHPVMVWIHGGAFQFGSSDPEMFGPERLLEEDIVLVTINYRLGPLGFMTTGDDSAPPNVGLMDQRLALEWVRDNIEAFCGDPGQVTLFGESAGGISVMAHLASPQSQGLFHKVISMSGVWGEVPFLHMSKPPQHYTNILAQHLGCPQSDSDERVACLQQKSPKELIMEGQKFLVFDYIPQPFKPVVDSWMPNPVLPQSLHEVWTNAEDIKVPLMIGGTKDEGVFFAIQFLKDSLLYDRVNENTASELPTLLLGIDSDVAPNDEGEIATAEVLKDSYIPGDGLLAEQKIKQMIQLFTDVHFLSPIDQVVRQVAAKTEKLFYYNYQHKGSFSLPTAFGIWENYGVSHADELFLLFKFKQVSGSWLGDLAIQTEQDIIVQRKLVKLWTQFAKTGKPADDESWSPVNSSHDLKYAVIDSEDLRMEYPKEFETKMELVQSLMRLARVHRAHDSDSHSHQALETLKEELARLEEEKWQQQREETLKKARQWISEPDIDADTDIIFEDSDFDFDDWEHDAVHDEF